MSGYEKESDRTRRLLSEHSRNYPQLQAEDVFKYLFQSAFGCEHLVSDEATVLNYILREYESVSCAEKRHTEALDGEYGRVYLSCLRGGLRAQTLARLFYLSARKEDGKGALEAKLDVAREMIDDGALPLDADDFDRKLGAWRDAGYPAIRHSDIFRNTYHPAYRVISNRYVRLLPLFTEIDRLLDEKGRVTVAIEGGSASGKTTLSVLLGDVYGCNVFHTDDFFLRPEQRTEQRLCEIGGNIDRERLADEIITPLIEKRAVNYRRFDCGTGMLSEAVTVLPKALTVVEGVYSMHPAFGGYYDLGVYLDIDPERQRKRILKRNTPRLAQRFFDEWIPLENAYFSKTSPKDKCGVVIPADGDE